MKSDIQNVSLKFKCSANWDEMTPIAGGRFCDSCAKVVYDFTDAKQADFNKIMAANSGNVCGRFRGNQLATTPARLPRWKRWLSAALVFIGINSFSAAAQSNLRHTGVKGEFAPKAKQQDKSRKKRTFPKSSPQLSSKKNDLDTLKKIDDDQTFFGTVDESAQFPGGMEAFFTFLKQNLKQTPEMKKGKVFVSYLVHSDGLIGDINILRGLSPENDAEALRVMKLMPKWIPGKRYGKPIDMQYTVPINFQ